MIAPNLNVPNGTDRVIDGLAMSSAIFGWTDYLIFFFMVIFSILIGIYFGCFGTKQKTTEEYLLGGKTMKAIPVGLSLVASHVSGITLVGTPSEVYMRTATYWFMWISLIFVGYFSLKLFVPVYSDLNIITIYEYLELRFDKRIRRFGSFMFTFGMSAFLPVVIYAPCLSLSQVTGINLHIISVLMTSVCVFYTLIGGVKAVVWTDFLQTIITVIAFVSIIIIGTIRIGGISHVWELAEKGGKLSINFDPNPAVNDTFWTIVIGIFATWFIGTNSSQLCVQKLISVPTKTDQIVTMIIFMVGVGLFSTISVYAGLLTFAAYWGCDPIERGIVSKMDQIYPHYILDRIGDVTALPGLFIAGVFSAALSSLSAGLNSMAGVIYQDYFKFGKTSEEKANFIMKSIIVVAGIFNMIAITVIEKVKGILSASYMINSISGASIGGVFIGGICLPYVNADGAFYSAILTAIFEAWIVIGTYVTAIDQPLNVVYPNINSTCPEYDQFHNITIRYNQSFVDYKEDDRFMLYRLPYSHYMTIGVCFQILMSLIISYFTGGNDLKKLNPKLIAPPLRRFLPTTETKLNDIEVELKLIENKTGKIEKQ